MKLLVTGASGFVGRNFIKTYSEKYHIYAIVREHSDIKDLQDYCEIFRHSNDITKLKDYLSGTLIGGGDLVKDKIFTQSNASSCHNFGILHLATKYTPQHTPNDIKDLIDANILFGSEILESTMNFKPKFFINILTFSQFANSTSYNPASFYDSTKEAFYDIIEFYRHNFKETKFMHILLYNTYGRYDTRDKFLNLWHRIALNNQRLEMSEGLQKIDISHIDDVVRGLSLAIDDIDSLDSSKIYTLENHPRHTLKDIAEIFQNVSGRKLNIAWGAKPYRINEIFSPISSLDSTKFMKLPNYHAKISLEDGIKDLISSDKR